MSPVSPGETPLKNNTGRLSGQTWVGEKYHEFKLETLSNRNLMSVLPFAWYLQWRQDMLLHVADIPCRLVHFSAQNSKPWSFNIAEKHNRPMQIVPVCGLNSDTAGTRSITLIMHSQTNNPQDLLSVLSTTSSYCCGVLSRYSLESLH